MKYSTEILINLPRTTVIELFDSTENLQQWQPGLKNFTHLEGEEREEGARSELIYEGRKGDLLMTETITTKRLPEQFHMTYRSRGVYNEVENWFTEKEPGVTLWRTENFFRFRGVMMLMVPFMKQAFIHNTMLNMDRFKLFAENNKQ
ncbi:MAG: SRPBCC family protein [Bacteroidales bacterium]|nr:SRPBCC family protein [Bacteroidales bacterium]